MKLGEILIALTSLARTGWMLRGIPGELAENVAEHIFSAAIIAYELSVEARRGGFQVDPGKAVSISLAHDLGEAVIGDITRRAGISEAKEEAEAKAYTMLEISEELRKLYEEHRAGGSLEAVIARISDGLATYLKARYYMSLGYKVEDIAGSSLGAVKSMAYEKGLKDVVEKFIERLEH